ncbi:Asp23/Gls24 family envelope stress response protein [Aminipila luticellarii]|uniref:Asp23/Gls24 family envelope stress response protein n=1 Tax=Aminipila luticellarii TaxID=2507160 RepID=A0A410PV62_9FIRM|nr:Asp23/Gls24 family envelope stress response protein [Aminipila luticellarii]QAT42841.1 Asp23/Gls24 family envelope stress response protein [Aminipila luticellarii]
MMSIEQEEKLGAVKISEDVIAICVINSALATKGVAGLSGGLTDTISKNILGKEPLKKGIKISKEDDEINIDIYVIVHYGVKIPEVAWNIQKNVKKEVENMVDIPIKAINIHVQGVHFAEQEKQEE